MSNAATQRIASEQHDSVFMVKGPLAAMAAEGWIVPGDVPRGDEHTLIRDREILASRCPGADAIEVFWDSDGLVKMYFFARWLSSGVYSTLRPIKRQSGSNVVALPTAAAVAPVQPARRGRFPKGVVPLWQLRNQRTSRLIEQQQREEKIKIARQGIQVFEENTRKLRSDLAQLMARE